jgi:hypothetical protein
MVGGVVSTTVKTSLHSALQSLTAHIHSKAIRVRKKMSSEKE